MTNVHLSHSDEIPEVRRAGSPCPAEERYIDIRNLEISPLDRRHVFSERSRVRGIILS